MVATFSIHGPAKPTQSGQADSLLDAITRYASITILGKRDITLISSCPTFQVTLKNMESMRNRHQENAGAWASRSVFPPGGLV